ncbi:MAG TPA: Ig-like domain-containing protein [Candidatus Wujingus californicus]|uniref:Ig-like domain-containing protein n=2 Tax=Candidatus Wujingus californicus TaxID=3367618 RepID=UPI001D70E2A0|nr:Ig-like domain-containing protein [Planctomycetota bacterium]
MENLEVNNKALIQLNYKKYIILLLTFTFLLTFCKIAFSSSISVSPNSLTIDVGTNGTATVEVLNEQGSPSINTLVTATSGNETVATVSPNRGLTNPNGQAFFTITGLSNGTVTITFIANNLSALLPVTVVSNIAPCGTASSSGGGTDEFGPEKMNDNIEKDDCSYHWIRTRNEIGQKKQGWIRLDWTNDVTISRMVIQTTDCNESCGEDSEDPLYIDPGRNIGSGMVQYLDEDEITWITDGEFYDEIGDVEYLFAKSITTKAIRIKKIAPNPFCKGQQSNPVIFEWQVYGIPSCN